MRLHSFLSIAMDQMGTALWVYSVFLICFIWRSRDKVRPVKGDPCQQGHIEPASQASSFTKSSAGERSLHNILRSIKPN
jgi:hypothetical protein